MRRRIRHGQKEAKIFRKIIRAILKFKFYKHSKETKRETNFTSALINVLKQSENLIETKSSDVILVDETYRPDFRIKKTIAVEVKFLKDHSHKTKLKESLAQVLVYSSTYKFVILVLVDLTKKRSYYGNDKRSDKNWGLLHRKLKQHHIEIAVVIPTD